MNGLSIRLRRLGLNSVQARRNGLQGRNPVRVAPPHDGIKERRAGISRFLGRGQPHRCPPPGSGAHRTVTHRTIPTTLAVLAGASLVASLLAVPLAAPVSAQDYAVIPQAEFGDCWDHMEPPERYTLDENGDAITVEGTTRHCAGTFDTAAGPREY